MRYIVLKTALTLATLLAVAGVGLACDGSDSGTGNSGSGSQPLKLDLPTGFPLYSGMEVTRGFQLGENYIFEAAVSGAFADILDFYEQELPAAGWEVVSREDLSDQGTVFFTADGYESDARLAAKEDKEESGSVTVGIAFPLSALQEANATPGEATPSPEGASEDEDEPQEDPTADAGA